VSHNTAPASTPAVDRQSLRESAAVALRVSESIISPIFLLNPLIQSFSRIDASIAHIESHPNSGIFGGITLTIPSVPTVRPIAIVITQTAIPPGYSHRAWPYGCSSSGFCAPGQKPSRLITRLPASLRLLTASAAIDMLPEIAPTINFPRKRRTLQQMP